MAKKDFKSNPAMSFISQESIDRVDKKPNNSAMPIGINRIPEGYKINHAFIEKKSRRVQILIQPSLYKDAKAISETLGISLNDFIHRAIHEATYNSNVLSLIKRNITEE